MPITAEGRDAIAPRAAAGILGPFEGNLVGIVFGVVAAICWGVGDFLIARLTRHVGTTRALIAIQGLSLLAWIGLLMTQPARGFGAAHLWWIILGTAVAHVLGLVLVYRAFEIGTLSIVSPISSGFAVVTALLSLVSGEHPPAVVLGGAGLLILGIVLATRSRVEPGVKRPSLAGVPEAILSGVAFGTMFWLFYFYVQPNLGYALPLTCLKVLATTSSVMALVSQRNRAAAPGQSQLSLTPKVVLLAVGAAAADTLAWLTYIWGTSTTYATVVTALASLFSVVTVLLAWGLLRERLARHQWAGVVVILLGILLVSV